MKLNYIKYFILTVILLVESAFGQTILRVTLPPDSISQTSGVLKGYYITNDTSWHGKFNFGKTQNYELTEVERKGKYSLEYIGDTVFISCRLEGLIPHTQWHNRLELYKYTPNNTSLIKYGNDVSFSTLFDSVAGGFIIPISIVYPEGRKSFFHGFGVHTHATTCIDFALGELDAPPLPPLGVGDFRFLSPPNSIGNCFGQGLFSDVRKYREPTQGDTFRIRIQPLFEQYPVVLKWENPSSQYAGEVRLLAPLNGSIVNTNMKTQQMDTIPEDVSILYVVAQSPINLLSSWYKDLKGNSVSTVGQYNPSGLLTQAWFQWGPTVEYGQETSEQNIGSYVTPVIFSSSITGLSPNTLYHYRVVTENINGISYSIDQTFETNAITSKEDEFSLPSSFFLSQNYPNPFNPTTAIRYSLSVSSHVTLKVYDVLGREMKTLVNEMQDVGYQTVEFDANSLPSGVYFYRIQARNPALSSLETFSETRKMLLIR